MLLPSCYCTKAQLLKNKFKTTKHGCHYFDNMYRLQKQNVPTRQTTREGHIQLDGMTQERVMEPTIATHHKA